MNGVLFRCLLGIFFVSFSFSCHVSRPLVHSRHRPISAVKGLRTRELQSGSEWADESSKSETESKTQTLSGKKTGGKKESFLFFFLSLSLENLSWMVPVFSSHHLHDNRGKAIQHALDPCVCACMRVREVQKARGRSVTFVRTCYTYAHLPTHGSSCCAGQSEEEQPDEASQLTPDWWQHCIRTAFFRFQIPISFHCCGH